MLAARWVTAADESLHPLDLAMQEGCNAPAICLFQHVTAHQPQQSTSEQHPLSELEPALQLSARAEAARQAAAKAYVKARTPSGHAADEETEVAGAKEGLTQGLFFLLLTAAKR